MMVQDLLFEDERKTSAVGCTAEPCADSAVPGPGLSKGHTVTTTSLPSVNPDVSHLRFWDGAGLLQVKNPYKGDIDQHANKEKKKRGEIIGHSPKSQRRARMFLAKIPNEEIMNGLLVTLTYPGKQAADKVPDASEYQIYKEHLRRFNQAIVRQWQGSGAWFLEFQMRGAPHYHLIVFGVPHCKMEPFQSWVSSEWNRIVHGGTDHLKAGTRVEVPKNCQAARNYVTAYFTKGGQAPAETKVGRYWGKFGTKSIPMAPEIDEELTGQQAKIATRTARRAVERHVWSSGWRRLNARMAKKMPSIEFLTDLEFRTLCENCRRGKITSLLKSCGQSAMYSHRILEVVAMMMEVEKIRFPRRLRHRSNSTINLYCDASSFCESLKRHPDWNEDQPDSEAEKVPVGKLALTLFPGLIVELKAACEAGRYKERDSLCSRLRLIAESIGFTFEEGWNDTTQTLFVVIRSGSGKVVLNHEL